MVEHLANLAALGRALDLAPALAGMAESAQRLPGGGAEHPSFPLLALAIRTEDPAPCRAKRQPMAVQGAAAARTHLQRGPIPQLAQKHKLKMCDARSLEHLRLAQVAQGLQRRVEERRMRVIVLRAGAEQFAD